MGAGGCAKSTMVKSGIKSFGPTAIDLLLQNILDTGSAELLKEGMPGQVVLVTGLTEMNPNSREALEQCCMLYVSYGMFIEDQNPKFATELYTIGKSYGIRALSTNEGFRKGLENGKKIPELVGALGKDYVPALCWAGLSTGLQIMHQMDDPMALMIMPDAVALMNRSVALDPDYFYGVGKSFLGAYYALVPAFLGLGGGPDVSAKTFEEARKITDGKFLMVDVFEARYLCTYTDDRKHFEELLNGVLKADSAALKGGRVLNELAKMKARYFLSVADSLF
jgi:hypothetical protein